ncbi:MAG: macrolide transporter ATP-binding protein [Ilumatobacteraceae bacterium]|nr:macrolide transporter ATP-binding protein [Ilumatobacteraceae bacterium]
MRTRLAAIDDSASHEAHDDTVRSPVVEMIDVGKVYGGAAPFAALQSCDLTIDRGEYLAVMGPSGSGKSTLLNMLGLLDVPTSGEYLLDGTATSSMSEAQRCGLRAHRIGFVFQAFHLVSYRTATENVETGLLYQRVNRRRRRELAIETLERVGLGHRLGSTPTQMSGGECQRVAIARAVVRRPALLLCDEPTGNLDSLSGGRVLELLDGLHNDGLSIVVITHDRGVGDRAQRKIEIRDGRIHPSSGGD